MPTLSVGALVVERSSWLDDLRTRLSDLRQLVTDSATRPSAMRLAREQFLHPSRVRKHLSLLLVFSNLRTTVQLMPKVATTLLKQLLWEHFLEDPCVEGDHWIHNAIRSAPFGAPNMRRSTVDRALCDPRFHRFMLVRNPYDRLLSAYHDKFSLRKPGSRVFPGQSSRLAQYAHAHRLPVATNRGVPPFGTFVRFAVSQPWHRTNHHWCEQVWLSLYGVVDYARVYRLEDGLDTMALALMTRLGAQESWVRARLVRPVNATTGRQTEGYTASLARLVYQRYRRDFDAFGYAQDSWMKA